MLKDEKVKKDELQAKKDMPEKDAPIIKDEGVCSAEFSEGCKTLPSEE